VLSGWNESVAMLAAPAGAGVLLATVGPGWVFAVGAAVALVSALLVSVLDCAPEEIDEDDELELHWSIVKELATGIAALRQEKAARMLVFVLATMFTAVGALDVVTVVIALDVLDLGQGGPGYLNACFGFGGVAAILFTATFVGRPKLIPWIIGAAAVWGRRVPRPRPALERGHGRRAARRGGRRLHGLRRRRPDAPPALGAGRHRLPVFGLMEAVGAIGMAAGSGFVPMIVSAVGVKAAIVGTGIVLPVALLLCGRALLHVDEHATVPVVEIALLRCVTFLQALPAPELESLARSLVRMDAEAGQVLTAEAMSRPLLRDRRRRGRHVDERRLPAAAAPREGFGEIALLHDVPRTATCVAVGPARLYALEREPFIAAVTGHRRSRSLADRLVDRRLASTPAPAPTP
jgi:hypothetical protein